MKKIYPYNFCERTKQKECSSKKKEIQNLLDNFDMKDRTNVDDFIQKNNLNLSSCPEVETKLKKDYNSKKTIFHRKYTKKPKQ